MRGIVGSKLNLCFSKMMRPFSPESPPNSTSLNSGSSPDDHPSSSSSSSILVKNFNSLYDHTFDPYEPEAEPADLATAFASERFFFSSPGRSNSIIQLPSSPSAPESPHTNKLFTNSVAVPTYSPDPYMDFRRSMQEMVEARPELMDVKSKWEMLQELLLCYLALNPRTTHKFIVGAFADLLVTLTFPPQEAAAGVAACGRS
ncbi:transcription repressor OFP12-like isoform X2 [Prosopis cineraria]|uniref:transcription repressor OFP12-like isoform X2 n=1 Tax=Prosopis cineraria TaxID=364024 RepID=UPI00240F47D3|nr:transcription repressor OFP12-like isoform X2 [Prosopis cineraria]